MRLPARRALTRMAWRDIRRNRRRSALVFAMIALPVFGLTVAGIVLQSATATPEQAALGDMGNADVVLWMDEESGFTIGDILTTYPGSTVAVESQVDTTTIVGGEVHYVTLRDVSPSDLILGPKYRLTSGEAPLRLDEIAVSPPVLEAFELAVGETITLGAEGTEYRIVGTVITPASLGYPFALVSPGSLEDAPGVFSGTYVDLPDGITDAEVLAALEEFGGFGYQSRRLYMETQGFGPTQLAILVAVGAVALAETGLIAAAAFVVGTRRKLRTMGIVGAAGAEPRHLRALVLAGAAWLGLAASVAGVVFGIVTCLGLQAGGVLSNFGDRLVEHIAVPPLLPVLVIALGTVAAVLAALAPARAAARIDTMSALAGRTPPPRPAGTIARWGLAVVAVGIALNAWGAYESSDALLIAGPMLTIGGLLLAIPLLVGLVGRSAGRLPLGLRIAARDTGRHGRRTGAAVAAATVALIVPVALATSTLANDAAAHDAPAMANDQLIVSFPADLGHDSDDVRELAGRLDAGPLPGVIVAEVPRLQYADEWGLDSEWGPWGVWASGPMYQVEQDGAVYDMYDSAPIVVGDHDLLRAMHAEAYVDELDAGYVIALYPNLVDNGVVHLQDPTEDQSADPSRLELRAVDASEGLHTSYSTPQLIISAERAAELDLGLTPLDQVLVRAAGPVTEEQLAAAKLVVAEFSGMFATGLSDLSPQNGPARAMALAFMAIVALAIIAVATALVAEESRRDTAILAAIGASSRTRRSISGGRTLLLAALAGILAIPGGFLPVTVYNMASGDGNPIIVPWVAIVTVVIALPLVAGAVAALLSRPVPAARLLRPLE